MITCDTCAMIQCGNHPTGLCDIKTYINMLFLAKTHEISFTVQISEISDVDEID